MTFDGVDLHPDLAAKAAALLYALARSQACTDGNKRIALILVSVFVRMNGYRFATTNDAIADTILRVAASEVAKKDLDQQELQAWLREVLVPEDSA